MDEGSSKPRLYDEFSSWWPLLSAPEDYAEEAEFYRNAILGACQSPPETMLELGSGGGNNASHLKHHFRMTLVDLSSGMLEVSRRLNPECEHLLGDMRSIRLDRLYDTVFIHDAIMYMTTKSNLRQSIETAYVHCKPGGIALFAPDSLKETFLPKKKHGGHDGKQRSLRYLEWIWDPDPSDSTCLCDFVYLLRDEHGEFHCEPDRHVLGLFERVIWLQLLTDVGFESLTIPFEHSDVEPGTCELFLGKKSIRS